jgi:tetratricopeptide (TPR) repeat protein
MMKAPNPAGGAGSRTTASPQAAAAMLEAALRRHRAGELEEAAALYARLLAVRPNDPQALHLSGLVAYQKGDAQTALPQIRRAIVLDGRQPEFHNSLGVVLLARHQAAQAAEAFRRALALMPDYAEAHNNLGNALQALGQPAAACDAYAAAIAIRPDYAEAHSNLSVALRTLGRLADAEAAGRAALAHNPRSASAFANLGLILQDRARYREALACTEAALALSPDYPEAHCNRAVQLLQLGRFKEGWAEYEWRWQTSGFTTPKRDFSEPLWDGTPLAGRTILLHAEQGQGSAIQFARYVPLVARCGGRVILECQRPLTRLFIRAFAGPESGLAAGQVSVVTKGQPLPRCDVQLPLMSLPGRMGTALETIPAHVPYLFAEEEAVDGWRSRLAARTRPRVGLVWAGNPNHKNDRNRSLPSAVLRPLVNGGVGSFVSLQVGEAAAQQTMLPAGRVLDPTAEFADFSDTAAVIAALDLVVSVDTAVAHLAGAMAKPVWLLVPFVAEWRWLLDRDTSPWYPTMRIFRQPAPGDWEAVVASVAAALAAWRRNEP